MSALDYLKMPPPPPQNTSPTQTVAPTPANHTHLSINDQMKLCSMKYKIIKNLAEMFQLSTIAVSPFRNAIVLQFLCMLIEKYKTDADQPILLRLHGIMENMFRTATISHAMMDECVYLLANPRVVEALYLFTN